MNTITSSVVTTPDTAGEGGMASTQSPAHGYNVSAAFLGRFKIASSSSDNPTLMALHLFELVAVDPRELLAVLDNGNIPRPHITNKLAVLLLGGVELGERVALIVRANLDSREVVLATDHNDTTDNTVVVDTVNGSSPEHVFAGSLKTVEETTYVC